MRPLIYGDFMNEKEYLISHILDLKEKCADESIITSTNFLSVDELSEALKTERINNQFVDTFYFGGYDDAERKVMVFVPKFYEIKKEAISDFLDDNSANPLVALKVIKDKFTSLSHRDYLGALMGLGIKREMIGDIIVDNDGCILFCLKSISEFICNNLIQAGRGQLTVRLCDTDYLRFAESKTEICFLSVASMRIDCLVAAAFKLSRNNAVEYITQGLVFVNSEQVLKADFILKQGDKLVLRGKGKTVIDEIIGESKKGRLHINIKKYI